MLQVYCKDQREGRITGNQPYVLLFCLHNRLFYEIGRGFVDWQISQKKSQLIVFILIIIGSHMSLSICEIRQNIGFYNSDFPKIANRHMVE